MALRRFRSGNIYRLRWHDDLVKLNGNASALEGRDVSFDRGVAEWIFLYINLVSISLALCLQRGTKGRIWSCSTTLGLLDWLILR